jgi:hypothetical protein
MSINHQNIWNEIGYEPHPSQALIHESRARFKVPCCGRRFGKTRSAVSDIWPDILKPNQQWWLVGPTYELGEREFAMLMDDVYAMPALANHKAMKISYSPKAGNMTMMFPWRTFIKVVSRRSRHYREGTNGANA